MDKKHDNWMQQEALSELTLEELLELLRLAPVPAGTPEEEAYVDALENVILDKERKTPTGILPDPQEKWAEFQTRFPEARSEPIPVPRRRPARVLRRIAALAAVLALCLISGVAIAQAAGVDVWGTFAQWSSGVFSFGKIRVDTVPEQTGPVWTSGNRYDTDYETLEDALEGSTELFAPAWLPEGYTLSNLSDQNIPQRELHWIFATYSGEEGDLWMEFMRYHDEPHRQIGKTDGEPETFEINGMVFYVIQGASSYTVAWLTEHWECYVFGPEGMSKEILVKIVSSMYE